MARFQRLSNKFNEYFEGKVRFTIVSKSNTSFNLLILTKNDILYELNVGDDICPLIALSNDNNIMKTRIESSKVSELSGKQIIDIQKSSFHTIALTKDGLIYCWGSNSSGHLALGFKDYNDHKPKVNKYLKNMKINYISVGQDHSLALTSYGQVYAWGDNEFGQIGTVNIGKCNVKPVELETTEKVTSIACGFQHSVLLTESGSVYGLGNNEKCKIGFGEDESPGSLNLLPMKDIIIKKISCGKFHTMLLSENNILYEFGSYKCDENCYVDNLRNNEWISVEYCHSKKFIDIAAHPLHSISIAKSENFEFYIWGQCSGSISTSPIQTKYKSFNEIFARFFPISYKINDEKFHISDDFIYDGTYSSNYKEIGEIGRGSFGTVYKIQSLDSQENYAIKIIKFKIGTESELLKEFEIFQLIGQLESDYIVNNYDAWLENNYTIDNMREHANSLSLYILMELCEKTLEDIMEEIENNSYLKVKEVLTPIGYYISSEAFIEMIRGVDYLHKHNPTIIHRDLRPANILFKRGKYGNVIKIADFGLITTHEFTNQLHSEDKGTAKYTAPEVSGGRKYDNKCDIYSLGIIMENLFNIDDDRVYCDENSSFLECKYQHASKLSSNMTNEISCERPDCEEILKNKNEWVYDNLDSEIRQEFDMIKTSEENKNSYVFSLIEHKLKPRKNSLDLNLGSHYFDGIY